jgi:SAM-dependent methyltransferase
MQTTTTNELVNHQRSMWAAVAPHWREHADYIDERAASMTAKLLELAALQPGDRVLELACGAGGLGLAAAARVAPGGEVVLSDVAAEMTSIAAARASALGLDNVSTSELDLDRIDQPDSSYDAVLCREGLMFARDHALAVSEIGRILRSGGRVALSVWGPRERNPWLAIVFDAVSAHVGVPMPPPGIHGPFALDDSERLAGLLSNAGLADVVVSELATPLQVASFDEWWTRTSALAGPLTNILSALPADAAHALRARVQEAASAYKTPAGLEFPGVSLLATARRP